MKIDQNCLYYTYTHQKFLQYGLYTGVFLWYSGISKLSQQVFGHIQEFFQDFSFGHLTSSRLDINSLPTTNRWSISKITTHWWLSTSKITAHWWWGATKIGSKLIWFIAH